MTYITRRKARKTQDEGASGTPWTRQSESEDVAALLEDIECCLAEATVVDEPEPKDDEELVAEEFAALAERYYDREIGYQQMKDEGSILKARFAHTKYIQSERCCSCGCPWND